MLWRHVQCLGNPGLEQRATTLPPLRNKSHSKPRGEEASEAPQHMGALLHPLPVTWRETAREQQHTFPFPSRHGSELSSLPHSHGSNLLRAQPGPTTLPTCVISQPAPPDQSWTQGKALPGRTGPACLIHPPLQTVYSRLSFAHLSPVSHMKNPCGVSDL